MSDDKERTVTLGCGTWFLVWLIIAALWGIDTDLQAIHHDLSAANTVAAK